MNVATIKELYKSSRPISWVNTAYPFATAYLLTVGRVDAVLIIGTLFFLIPYNLLMYGINDVFDYESDLRNPRKGGIEGALLSKSLHKATIWASILTTLPFVLILMVLGTTTSNLTLIAVLGLVVAYSAPKLRFKERPVIDSLTSSSHFVGPAVYALSLAAFPRAAWSYIGAFFLWGMASHAFGAVQDVIPDRQADIKSIGTIFGAALTVRLTAILYAMSTVILFAQGTIAIPAALCVCLYIANVCPYLNISDKKSERANRGWRRFIWLNLLTGAVVTISLILNFR